MKLRNLCPHPLSILRHDGSILALPVEGCQVPRRAVVLEHLWWKEGMDLARTTLGPVENLPAPEPETWLIVSTMVAEGAPEREDLVSPGEAVRDDAGRVVGARGLSAGPGLARKLARGHL